MDNSAHPLRGAAQGVEQYNPNLNYIWCSSARQKLGVMGRPATEVCLTLELVFIGKMNKNCNRRIFTTFILHHELILLMVQNVMRFLIIYANKLINKSIIN